MRFDLDDSAPESIFTNRRHGIRQSDRSQTATATESLFPDAPHGFGNVDGGQATTVLVFANRFISIVYALNGRKVIT